MDKNILILEDEKEIAELYAKYLNAKGYRTELAHNGIEGLEKLKTFTPQLILLDINMPIMGGLEFYQKISAQQGPKYPVMVVTTRSELEDLFRDFQVDGFIVKPFEPSRLIKEVDIIFSKHYLVKSDIRERKIILIEDIHESAKKIFSVFSNAGFRMELAESGVEGIEKIMNDPPDLCIIKLGLFDIPGDKVITRLQQITKTKNARTLLYIPQGTEHDKIELERVADIKGIKHRVVYNTPVDLLNATNDIFHGLQQTA